MNKDPEIINWANFRSWASKNWGISPQAKISGLDDDLWMLECSSAKEVERIVSLNRVFYEATKIFLDGWTPEVGRTSVLRKQGLAWIVAEGVPLHLRSGEAFRGNRDVCGGYVEHDVSGTRMSSVRIKIRMNHDHPRPASVSLCCGEESFVVPIRWGEAGLDVREPSAKNNKGKDVLGGGGGKMV
ncbi:hypothetical protein LINPERPRIM_LOCUS2856 [Linum perenne]